MSVEIRDRRGGVTIVYDMSVLGDILEADRKFDAECDAFHDRMMSLGVKAYRSNDGWVDRENHNVTFFSSERTRGYYWGNMHLEKGDKIYIGSAYSEGKFALIENVVERGYHSVTYHYSLIEDEPERKEGWFRRMIHKIFKI